MPILLVLMIFQQSTSAIFIVNELSVMVLTISLAVSATLICNLPNLLNILHNQMATMWKVHKADHYGLHYSLQLKWPVWLNGRVFVYKI